MDQSKVNPFVGNTETSAGGSPVSAPSNPVGAPAQSAPSAPVNPYAPAGAPYAPGSNTPAPDYATTSYTTSSDGPAVPNTGSSAYTNFSPAPSQNYASSEKPKLFTKKFIIFAVIGIVLIIAAVVAGVVIQNNKKPKSTSNSAKVSDYKDALNTYTNYIISGTASSDDKKNTYDESSEYFLATKLHNYTTNTSSRPEAKTIIYEAEKYFKAYYKQAFNKEPGSADENELENSVDVYSNVLSMLDYIITNQPEESNDIASANQFIQGLRDLGFGSSEVYASLYFDYIDSGKSEDDKANLDNFVNSYAEYLLYNCSDLSDWTKEVLGNE